MQLQRLSLFSLFLSTGCASADRVEKLEARIAELERKASEAPAPGPSPQPQPPTEDPVATKLYQEMGVLDEKGDYAGALAKGEELVKSHPNAREAKTAKKRLLELQVIGKPAPAELKVERWYQGDAVSLTGGEATLIVFWEEWCPHCKREVPELVKTYDQYKGQGLQVVGLTKITRKATEEGVQAFIKENGVSYPMAKETGEMSEYFNVSGIPAAAVVKDGQVVWRGHPGRISPQMLTSWLGS